MQLSGSYRGERAAGRVAIHTRGRIGWLAAGVFLAGLAGAPVFAGPPAADPVRAFLEERLRADPDDMTAWNRLGGLCLAELRRTGDWAALARAEAAARESLRAVPAEQNFGGLALRAQAALAAHRFAAARDDGRWLTQIAPSRGEAWMLLGDACFELGDYGEAEQAWGELRRLEPASSATELRRSRLAFLRGDRGGAARRLKAALALAETMTPRPVETTAWCRVQLGQMAFSAGDWKGAETAYRGALADLPGWYVAEDHLAELLAARGDFAEATRLYAALAERTLRPEIWQALGEVLAAAGRPEEAAVWQGRALAAYLAGAETGNAHYYHHLAGFYADVRGDAAGALRWARQDLELRQGVSAWDALAWALYRGKDHAGAAQAVEKALAPGIRDAHLLTHAALIFVAAGDPVRGRACRREALAVNPRADAFHVHR